MIKFQITLFEQGEVVGSNDTRNVGSRKHNIRPQHIMDFWPFGLSSLTLSISEQCVKWVKQCI